MLSVKNIAMLCYTHLPLGYINRGWERFSTIPICRVSNMLLLLKFLYAQVSKYLILYFCSECIGNIVFTDADLKAWVRFWKYLRINATDQFS